MLHTRHLFKPMIVLASLLSISAFATNIEYTMQWGEAIQGGAGVQYQTNDYTSKIFATTIGHSTQGKQLLYFFSYDTTPIYNSSNTIKNSTTQQYETPHQKTNNSSIYIYEDTSLTNVLLNTKFNNLPQLQLEPQSNHINLDRNLNYNIQEVESLVNQIKKKEDNLGQLITQASVNSKFNQSSSSTTTQSIISFNNQPVKMLKWEQTFSDTGEVYELYTPQTRIGYDFVLNLFKKSSDPITIKFKGDTIQMPVMGFTKAWNSFGGNAI